jgi:hypothetical protein
MRHRNWHEADLHARERGEVLPRLDDDPRGRDVMSFITDDGGPQPSSGEDDEDSVEDVTSEVGDAMLTRLTVSMYLDELSLEGRLCPTHVMQYMLWGKRRINSEGKLKTLLFLRAMYGGTGASRRQGQEMLNFVHSLGAVPHGMPDQIQSCWKLVTKVRPLPCMLVV